RSSSTQGQLVVISDQEKGTVTLLDPKGKRFATASLSDYAEKLKASLPEMPPAAKQMLENMKIDVKTDKTGKTETIKGIKTEEMLVTMSIEMPGPMAAMGGMNMEVHLWAATKDELERMPALKEFVAYMTAQVAGTDLSSTMSKMFGQIPGIS